LDYQNGTPAGLLAVVHKVGTDGTGEWSFNYGISTNLRAYELEAPHHEA